MGKKTLGISVDEPLYYEIENLANCYGLSKSCVVRLLMREKLAELREVDGSEAMRLLFGVDWG